MIRSRSIVSEDLCGVSADKECPIVAQTCLRACEVRNLEG